MRTPRRDFVVEYRSGRRQIKAQSSSIWGNLDLGAVARQVDADDILPKAAFPADLQEPAPSQMIEVLRGIDAEIDEMQDVGNPVTSSSATDAPAALSTSTRSKTHAGRIKSADGVGVSSAPRSVAKKRKKRAQRPDNFTASVKLAPSDVSGPDDELAALDAENRQLKLLMVAKLRAENNRLSSMLAGIDARIIDEAM